MKRVGHKGADLIAPGNTMASFDAALGIGVDMIEFDVMPISDGRLVLAHDQEDATGRTPLTLDEGLDHLAGDAFAGIELDVDMKAPGYEREVADGLRQRGLEERALVSSHYPRSLERIGALMPGVPRGLSVPRVRRDWTRTVLAVPAYGALGYYRARLPRRMGAALRSGLCEAVMAHWQVVTPALVRSVQAAGGALYVWTVDDVSRMRRLATLGVDGIITNDPRLFRLLADLAETA